jgi:hypothetical protein
MTREGRPRSGRSGLPGEVALRSREMHEAYEIRDVRISSEDLGSVDGRRQVQVVVDGTGHTGPLRSVVRWFVAEDDQLWQLCLTAPPAIDTAVRTVELSAAVRSWHLAPIGSNR